MNPARLAILCDFAEENWPSMDMAATALLGRLRERTGEVQATRIQPLMKRHFRAAFNADRLINRMWHYPRLAGTLSRFDLFHVIDHSYSQLVHRLPPGRTVVTCHDLDTFRCLFEPAREPRSYWFRSMVRHILRGLEKAAAIVCVSEATRAQLLRYGVAAPDRVRVIHNGIDPCFTPAPYPEWDRAAARLLGPPGHFLDLLHVGSTIPRKRIDVLLRVFAACRKHHPNLRLVRVGAPFTPAQRDLLRSLGLEGHVVSFAFLGSRLLAAIYRRASLLLLPSETEGFGLPLAEALACGAPVIASDIPALREVAGPAEFNPAEFCPVASLASWVDAVSRLLRERQSRSAAHERRIAAGIARARRFSWDRNAAETLQLYQAILSSPKLETT